ncbi:MAG: hypothetical protein CMM45_05525 [Rhodospirillaceae bacterium]|nr:hypothetical protein [Rhodospirillaceae bacterium]
MVRQVKIRFSYLNCVIGLAWIAIGLKELNAYDGEDIGRLFPANVIQCSLKRFTHCLLVLCYYAAFLGDQSIS